MANVKEVEKWEPGIYQLETTDPVMGGEDGIDNLQAKQLANRTSYLKKQIENVSKLIPTVPVQSVNGKTGNIQLSAADVGTLTEQQLRERFLPAKLTPGDQPIYEVGDHVSIKDKIGEQWLSAFRVNELPFGCYFRNGDNFLLSSPQGKVLNSLPNSYKLDYGIIIKTINGQHYINVPNAFYSDGRGYFDRAVNGITRQTGSVEPDAIRNIQGVIRAFSSGLGAFITIGDYGTSETGGLHQISDIEFSAARTVPTGPENTVLNQGKTPVIYLGV